MRAAAASVDAGGPSQVKGSGVLSTIKNIKSTVPYITFRRYNKALRRLIKLPGYLGTSHVCPICGVGLRAFKPMWKSYGRNIERFGYVHRHREMETFNLAAMTCPKCDATDRERLMAVYLDEAWPSFPPGKAVRLFDFAPAYPLSQKLNRYPSIAYRSADLSRRDVQDHIDLTNIAYADESADIFICSHILEHIPDDRKAMRELRRILHREGFGLMLVPLVIGVDETTEEQGETSVEYRWKHFGMGDHVRQYGRRDFVDRLTQAGFKVEQLGIAHFGAEKFRRHGIAENSILYVVRR
ncbi:MAG: class I SAM-dependent methyltransferase [Xanthobacteraceae bacterium]|nr:class I SAM-dependent methyltransferase [Xanthobacteraceae bacterium]